MRRLRTHRQFPRRSKGAGLRTALELILRVRRVALSASNNGFARGPPYVRGPSSARAAASLLRVTTGLPMLFVEMRGEMACLLRSLGSDGMVSSVASRLPPEATLAIGSRLLLACSSSQDGKIREDFMRYRFFAIAVALAASWAIASSATAQQGSSTQQVTPDPASNPDQELGRRFVMRPENLPLPKSDPVAASRSLLIPYAGQAPRVIEGFTVTAFIVGLEHPRRLLVLPNNDVIVAE